MFEFSLKELMHENFPDEKVFNWEFISDDIKEGKWRLYYKINPCYLGCMNHGCNEHGFYFVSVGWAGNNTHEETWGENTWIEILYHGTAYFDGLRHVYFGNEKTDNYGYIFYPHAQSHIEIWNQLKLLEEKYCCKD